MRPFRQIWPRYLLLCTSHAALWLSIGPIGNSIARAEESKEDARVLFREGRQLASQGFYQAACSKFEKSLRIEAGVGTEFNLAECWEQLGRTASAHQLFVKVALASQSAGQDKRAQAAFEKADRLLTRLSRLQIQCDTECPDGIRVLREGVELKRSSWLEPVEVDPGTFRVEVPTSSGTAWSTQVAVSGDPGVVVVSVPSVAVNAAGKGVHSEVPAVAPQEKPTERSDPLSPSRIPTSIRSNSASPWPRALLYTGIGGFALGGVAAIWFNNRNDQARGICPSNEGCSSAEIDRHDQLVHDSKLARVGVYTGLGLGVTAISAAAIWHYGVRPSKSERPPQNVGLRFHSEIHSGAPLMGVSAEGSF